MGTSGAWTSERRAKQSAMMHERKPWLRSTGPQTEEGKAASSRNAFKGSCREEDRRSERAARVHLALLRELIARHGVKPLSQTGAPLRKRSRSASAAERADQRILALWLRANGLQSLEND